MKVIDGGRIADGFVITGAVKAALVTHLQNIYHQYVWAFGDSVVDLDMLRKADQAIVVVGKEQTRSKTVNAALTNTVDGQGLRAHQVVLPSSVSPRLNTAKLPPVQLSDPSFIDSIHHHDKQIGLQVYHATDRSATKLLMTPMRDAAIASPELREAHRRIGWYLATKVLSNIISL